MSIRNTTALVSVGIMLASASAFAGGHTGAADTKKPVTTYQSVTIDALPDEGRVSISGLVEDLDGDNEFSLQDSKGESIRVESDRDLMLREGDRVKVIGIMDRGFLSIGSEIDAINITVLQRATASTKQKDDKDYRTTIHYPFDDNVDYDWKGEEYGAIDKLPDSGDVSLTATVENVFLDDQVLIVKDSTGDTIDVHTMGRFDVKKGDTVVVRGRMVDEFAGLGEEIVSARVEMKK